MRKSKNAIALLITIMFVIVITVAIGVGLKQINSATKELKTEKFMYQSTLLIEDVLKILSENKELKAIVDERSVGGMFLFLSQAKFIPFESSGLSILLSITSARSKFNLNQLNKNNLDSMRYYLGNYAIDSSYVDLLLDVQGGIKLNNDYHTNVFDENPYLFRDYIVSSKHLKQINDSYAKEYNENNLKNVNLENLFYFTGESNTSIDLNYATKEVWEMMLNTDSIRAEELSLNGGSYNKMKDINLNSDEMFKLSKFKISLFEPIILVHIEIMNNQNKSEISFEYNFTNKKGSNFVYKI